MQGAKSDSRERFKRALTEFVSELRAYTTTDDGQWTVKGFIDAFKNVYTISSDTKVVSKILEIHIFPKILDFAASNGFRVVPADHQNYYPDISFVGADDPSIRFAVDFKTTYRLPTHEGFCNGFTLGSHGKYFTNRTSTKNIQFPYGSYQGHFCLGIIYSRAYDRSVDETGAYALADLKSIVSVVKDFEFFVAEKWQIASDRSGSGNTANIGSINCIADIIAGRGMFSDLGEQVFDDYWMNYRKISAADPATGAVKVIANLPEFLDYKGASRDSIVARAKRRKQVLVPGAERES